MAAVDVILQSIKGVLEGKVKGEALKQELERLRVDREYKDLVLRIKRKELERLENPAKILTESGLVTPTIQGPPPPISTTFSGGFPIPQFSLDTFNQQRAKEQGTPIQIGGINYYPTPTAQGYTPLDLLQIARTQKIDPDLPLNRQIKEAQLKKLQEEKEKNLSWDQRKALIWARANPDKLPIPYDELEKLIIGTPSPALILPISTPSTQITQAPSPPITPVPSTQVPPLIIPAVPSTTQLYPEFERLFGEPERALNPYQQRQLALQDPKNQAVFTKNGIYDEVAAQQWVLTNEISSPDGKAVQMEGHIPIDYANAVNFNLNVVGLSPAEAGKAENINRTLNAMKTQTIPQLTRQFDVGRFGEQFLGSPLYDAATNTLLDSPKDVRDQSLRELSQLVLQKDELKAKSKLGTLAYSKMEALDHKVAEASAKMLNAIDSVQSDLYRLRSISGYAGTLEDFLIKLGREAKPGQQTDFATLNTKLAMALSAYMQSISGTAVNPEEVIRLQEQMPSVLQGVYINTARSNAIYEIVTGHARAAYAGRMGANELSVAFNELEQHNLFRRSPLQTPKVEGLDELLKGITGLNEQGYIISSPDIRLVPKTPSEETSISPPIMTPEERKKRIQQAREEAEREVLEEDKERQ